MNSILAYKRKENICYQCKSPLDAETEVTNDKTPPVKGDISLCIHCGALYQFDKNLNLQPADDKILTKEEKIMVKKMREAIKALKYRKDKYN